MLNLLLPFVLLVLAIPCWADNAPDSVSPAPYILKDNFEIELVTPYVRYLKDEGGHWSPEYVMQNRHSLPWEGANEEGITLGGTSDIYWFALDVAVMTEQAASPVFCIKHGSLYRVDTSIFRGERLQKTQSITENDVFSKRPLQHSDPCIVPDFQTNTSYTVLYRVDARSYLDFPLNIYPKIDFYNENSYGMYVKGVYYGMIFLIVMYSFFLALYVRDRSYFYYVGFIASFGLFFAHVHGDAFRFLWPNYPVLNQYAQNIAVVMANFFAALFSLSFLKLKEHTPWLANLMWGIISLSLVLLVAGFTMTQDVLVPFIALSAFVSYPCYLLAGVVSWRKGVRYARFFTLAWAFLCLLTSYLGVSMLFGLSITNLWGKLRLASIAEMTLLALALAERINILRQERDDFQSEALAASQGANELKDNFMSTITHELLTPINGIRLGLALLRPGVKEPEMEYLVAAESSNLHMLSLVNSMITFTEARRGTLVLTEEPFNVKDHFVVVHKAFSAAHKNNVQIRLEYHPETPQWIMADETKLIMIAVELMKNAVSFADNDGVVFSCTGSSKGSESWLEISLQDFGAGISEDLQLEIFDAFSQVDTSATRGHSGLGIGLSNVRDLLKLMNGTLSLESVIGRGSRFTAKIPVTLPSASAIEKAIERTRQDEGRPAAKASEQHKILVVEDNAMNLDLLVRILQISNYKPITAKDGEQALKALAEHPDVAAVLMDCQMPVMDGYEATARIRQMDQFIDLPIIAVTANVSATDRQRCWAVGMNDYLSKPVKKPLLLNTLASWTRKS